MAQVSALFLVDLAPFALVPTAIEKYLQFVCEALVESWIILYRNTRDPNRESPVFSLGSFSSSSHAPKIHFSASSPDEFIVTEFFDALKVFPDALKSAPPAHSLAPGFESLQSAADFAGEGCETSLFTHVFVITAASSSPILAVVPDYNSYIDSFSRLRLHKRLLGIVVDVGSAIFDSHLSTSLRHMKLPMTVVASAQTAIYCAILVHFTDHAAAHTATSASPFAKRLSPPQRLMLGDGCEVAFRLFKEVGSAASVDWYGGHPKPSTGPVACDLLQLTAVFNGELSVEVHCPCHPGRPAFVSGECAPPISRGELSASAALRVSCSATRTPLSIDDCHVATPFGRAFGGNPADLALAELRARLRQSRQPNGAFTVLSTWHPVARYKAANVSQRFLVDGPLLVIGGCTDSRQRLSALSRALHTAEEALLVSHDSIVTGFTSYGFLVGAADGAAVTYCRAATRESVVPVRAGAPGGGGGTRQGDDPAAAAAASAKYADEVGDCLRGIATSGDTFSPLTVRSGYVRLIQRLASNAEERAPAGGAHHAVGGQSYGAAGGSAAAASTTGSVVGFRAHDDRFPRLEPDDAGGAGGGKGRRGFRRVQA